MNQIKGRYYNILMEIRIYVNESSNNSTNGRILFVDSDNSMQKVMQMLMSKHCHVITAGSAEEGLELVASENIFDIIMSGFTLLNMNGLEFLRRAGELCPTTIRVLMSGGCGDITGINEAITEGHVSRLILKPFCMITMQEQLIHDLLSVRTLK